jgi:hypothetical protein
MNFGLAINITVEIDNKADIIQCLSDDLKKYFENKWYGSDIKSYFIGVVCVSPQFDQFFKEKKPKYTKGKKVIAPDGIPFTLEDNFEYSIKIDFEFFKNAGEEEAKKILAKELLASLTIVEQVKTKIKNFDLEAFKSDLTDYFQERKLL